MRNMRSLSAALLCPSKAQEESAYYDPEGTARMMILASEPVPVDLIVELEGRGIIFEEFKDSLLQAPGFGFSLAA